MGSAQCTSSLVASGQYLGVLGSMFLHFRPPSVRLKVLPVELPIVAPPISVITLKNRTLSPVAQLFIDFAREVTNRWPESPSLRSDGLCARRTRWNFVSSGDPPRHDSQISAVVVGVRRRNGERCSKTVLSASDPTATSLDRE